MTNEAGDNDRENDGIQDVPGEMRTGLKRAANVFVQDPKRERENKDAGSGGQPGRDRMMLDREKLAPSPSFQGLPFNMPSGLAIAPDGCLFVSDGYGGHRVHKFSSEGELIKSWGKEGTGPGEFALLHNVWVDKNSRVYIADRENNRMQIFDDEGNFIEEWTDMTAPGDLWIHDDIIYVIEQGGGNGVSIWTMDGELLTRWRGNEGAGLGTLIGGHGICVDSQGSIYVTEIGQGERVSKFVRV